MKITLLCSDPEHPVNGYIQPWAQAKVGTHEVEIVQKKAQIQGGEILFLISCSEIITASDRAKYKTCLVLHASDLPKGRGWSPHIWELVQGAETITLTMLEAKDKVDSGRIWRKARITVPKHALWDEINHLLFAAEVEMIDYAVQNYGQMQPQEQTDTDQVTYFRKRTPLDSQIDANKSIAEQFDLIRVCDPNRFPAYFEHLGQRYILKLEKSDGK
jgi:methionyl-tRNA formyltransferase